MRISNDEGVGILLDMLAKSEEMLMILPNGARDRAGRKALETKKGPWEGKTLDKRTSWNG
jgi:hypothetical protein